METEYIFSINYTKYRLFTRAMDHNVESLETSNVT